MGDDKPRELINRELELLRLDIEEDIGDHVMLAYKIGYRNGMLRAQHMIKPDESEE